MSRFLFWLALIGGAAIALYSVRFSDGWGAPAFALGVATGVSAQVSGGRKQR